MGYVKRNRHDARLYLNTDKLFLLNGTTNTISLADWIYQYVNNNHNWGFSAIVKPSNTNDGAIVSAITSGQGWFLKKKGGTIRATFNTTEFDTGIVLNNGIKNHIAISFTPTTIKAFHNGNENYSTNHTLSTFENTGNNLFLGSNMGVSGFFEGEISHALILSETIEVSKARFLHKNVGRTNSDKVIFSQDFQGVPFKADLAFTNDNPSFSIGDNLLATTESDYNLQKKTAENGIISDETGGITRISIANSFSIGDVVTVWNGSVINISRKIISGDSTHILIEEPFSNFTTTTGIVVDNSVQNIQYMKIEGKSDDELGIPNGSSLSTTSDFYNNRHFNDTGLLIKDNQGYVSGTDTIVDYSTPFTLNFEFIDPLIEDDDDVILMSKTTGGGFKLYISFVINGGFIQAFTFRIRDSSNLDKSISFTNSESIKLKQINNITISYDGIDLANSLLMINGILYPIGLSLEDAGFNNASVNFGTTINFGRIIGSNGARRSIYIVRFQADNFFYNEHELQKIYCNETLPTPLIELTFNNVGESSVISKQGQIFNLNNYLDLQIGSKTWLNNVSFLPPIVQYANLNGVSLSRVHVPIDEDFTIIWRGKIKDIDSTFKEILGLNESGVNSKLSLGYSIEGGVNPRIRLGNGLASNLFIEFQYQGVGSQNPFSIDNQNTIIVNFERQSLNSYIPTIFVNGFEFTGTGSTTSAITLNTSEINELVINGSLGDVQSTLVGISVMNLSAKQIAEIGNNNLPPKEFVDIAWSLFEFQKGSGNEDGTDVFLTNLGSGVDLTFSGLTGVTSVDKLTDFRDNKVINIY